MKICQRNRTEHDCFNRCGSILADLKGLLDRLDLTSLKRIAINTRRMAQGTGREGSEGGHYIPSEYVKKGIESPSKLLYAYCVPKQ